MPGQRADGQLARPQCRSYNRTMIPQLSPSLVKHLIDLALDGVGVAFFAWLVSFVGKFLFGGGGTLLKALSHGWRSFAIASVELDIIQTQSSIERPQVAIGTAIVALFASVFGGFSVLLGTILEFVDTYFPTKGYFASKFNNPGEYVNVALTIIGTALLFLAMALILVQCDRLISPQKRIKKLELRRAALTKGRAPRSSKP
jgi:hypothetical protein